VNVTILIVALQMQTYLENNKLLSSKQWGS